MQYWTLDGEDFPLPLPPNKWLQAHFALLAKTIAYAVFSLKSHSVIPP